jgi:hypothetical protein
VVTPSTQRLRSVFAPVTALSFNARQRDDCSAFLTQRSADTESVPIVDEGQLILSADGRVAESGYRFNAIGFAAVSNSLVQGLNSVFNELTGETRGRYDLSIGNGDVATAVGVYNAVLRSRFEVLRERTLLINHREKTIDGFLGLDHRLLDNSVFFNMVAEEIQVKQPQAEFYRAEIIGREIRIYYIDAKTKRTDIHIDPRHIFAGGWYFSNREDSGFAMRASMCVMTKFGPAIENSRRGTRVRHTGADLVGRAASMITKIVEREIDTDVVAKNVKRLLATSLNFSDSKHGLDAAMENWINYLLQFKISREDARQICKNAAMLGSDIDPRNPIEVYTKEVMTTRSVYDLFCSILRYSRNQYHTTRDLLQTAAMQLLVPHS